MCWTNGWQWPICLWHLIVHWITYTKWQPSGNWYTAWMLTLAAGHLVMSFSKFIPFLFCVLKKQTAGQYNTWLLKATILLQHVAFCWCEDLVVFCPNPCYEASPIFNISRTSFSLHFRGHFVCRCNIAPFPLCWTWIALSPFISFPQNWHWPLQGAKEEGQMG